VPKSLTGKNMADGMHSNDKEYVDFVTPIYLDGPVELWLRDVGESSAKTSSWKRDEQKTKRLGCGDISAGKR